MFNNSVEKLFDIADITAYHIRRRGFALLVFFRTGILSRGILSVFPMTLELNDLAANSKTY